MLFSQGVGFTVLLFAVTGSEVKLRRVRRGWLSGGRPSGVPCAFNPCTVSNFCGTGRTCEINDNCRHTCKCDPDSEHELCSADVSMATTPAPRRCTFNLCDIPSACSGIRKCSLDDVCRIQCECTSESTHESCVSDSENTTKQSATVTSVAVCNKTCHHGVCVHSDDVTSCQCDEGWGGETCDERHDACTLECGQGSTCVRSSNMSQACMPDPDATVTEVVPSTANQTTYNICSQGYDPKDKAYQSCGETLRCQHGTCVVHDDHMVCECDPGAAGVECDARCCLDCGDNGSCSLSDDMVEVCKCHRNFTGENCSIMVAQASPGHSAKPGTWYLWVAGVSAAMLLVLLVLLVAVPYVLWRHRVILVMKIIHYFQSYEDDDDRQWDAFVSYKSSTADEKFVVRTLFPKLEKELGFRLHLHFRDFVPGDTIANNIIRAVLGSRRTILVVSPEFACAEWTKFEYQVAQQEMLKRKHRIIPIVLEDLSDCKSKLDPNLKAILEAVTYLEWPKCGTPKKVEKFWKRLELSLPKKKASPVEQDSGVDNSGYDTIRPDAVDVSMVSEKTDRGLQNGYTTCPVGHEPEEDYDTINEAEMDERNRDLNEKNTDHGEKNTNVSEKIKDLDERYRDINEKYSSRKNTDIYLDILNGETLQTVEV